MTIGEDGREAERAGVGYLTPAGETDLFLYVVRHGNTAWNRAGRLQGQIDVELSDAGCSEAKRLADALAPVHFEAAYSSDLRRCVQTAEIVLDGRGVPLTTNPALREEDFGAWTGKAHAEIARLWPDQWKARERDRIHARPEGGESLGDLERRVMPCLEKIAEDHPRGNVLVVTHGGPAFVFFSRVMAPDGKLRGNFSVANCALNIVAHTRFGWKIQLLNDTCHLC